MLALSRRIGESIVIGNDIEVKIVDVRGNKVRIGIEAPKYVRVCRKELLGRITGDDEGSEGGDA